MPLSGWGRLLRREHCVMNAMCACLLLSCRADGLGRRTYIFVRNGAAGSPCAGNGVCTGASPLGATITTPEYVIPGDVVCSGGCVLQVVSFSGMQPLRLRAMHSSVPCLPTAVLRACHKHVAPR